VWPGDEKHTSGYALIHVIEAVGEFIGPIGGWILIMAVVLAIVPGIVCRLKNWPTKEVLQLKQGE